MVGVVAVARSTSEDEMNLRDLSAEEMLTVSAPLLDPGGSLYPILIAHTLLDGSVTVIKKCHDGLLTVQQRAGTNEKKARRLTDQMTHLDARHDAMARGIMRLLEGEELLAESEEQAQVFADVRETLFPVGASIVQRSYREQAGTAKRVESRLTDDVRAVLEAIPVGSTTLLEKVQVWLSTAQEIARKEAQRAELTSDDNEDAVSAGEVRDARLKWIKAVNSMINMLDFTDINERDRRILLANLNDASSKAARRRRVTIDSDQADDERDEAPQVDDDAEPAITDPLR